jgi:hypothetical protein
MFQVNPALIAKAKSVFANRRNVYWILGGAGAGKSTICQAVAARSPALLYNMDEHIYGTYFSRYDPQRHPANTAWLSAPNPLAWMLTLSLPEFTAFNRATTAEYLDLLADDLRTIPPDQPVLIDGGITHPALAAQVLDPRQMVCLTITDAKRVDLWETAEARAEMRQWISQLPDPKEMWRRFLVCDAAIASTMEDESRASQISLVQRHPHDSVEAITQRVAEILRCRV